MEPTLAAYLWQAAGISPAQKGEYSEVRGDQASRRGELTRRSQRLRRAIAEALIDGDMETAREYIKDAQSFDRDNPAFAVIPDIENAITRRLRERALANATGTSVGVKANDTQGAELTQYANFN